MCEWLSTGNSFWIRGVAFVHLSSQLWTPPCTDIWSPCACCYSLVEFICSWALFLLECLISLVFTIFSASYILSASSPIKFHKLWGEGTDKEILCSTKYSKVAHTLHFPPLWDSAFISCTAGRSFSADVWVIIMLLGMILLLGSFSKNNPF